MCIIQKTERLVIYNFVALINTYRLRIKGVTMYNDYTSLSEEELDEKMEDVMKKINIAHRQGMDHVVEQLEHHLKMLQLELDERLQKMRFDMVNERIPDSFIVGEDNDTDAPTDNN